MDTGPQRDSHTVPGSQVFVDDLPAGQVAHSTGDLNGHINQVLLGDGLKDKKTEAQCVILTFQDPHQTPLILKGDDKRAFQPGLLWFITTGVILFTRQSLQGRPSVSVGQRARQCLTCGLLASANLHCRRNSLRFPQAMKGRSTIGFSPSSVQT